MNLPERKNIRLQNFDYNLNGKYFITICVKERKKLLSKIFAAEHAFEQPKIILYEKGEIANKYITQMNDFYGEISIEKYTIMPDHIHLILCVQNGQSGTPAPANRSKKHAANSAVSRFVSTFKRFCNKEYGENIWQSRYYDHVIRNDADYNEVLEYIENNPINWLLKHEK